MTDHPDVNAPHGIGQAHGGSMHRQRPFGAWASVPQAWVALAAVLLGLAGSAALALTVGQPGIVAVPASIGLLVALALVPFPLADRAFAFCLIATFPLLPAIAGLPNLPVGAAIVGLALFRVGRAAEWAIEKRALVIVGGLWGLVLVGSLLAVWPPVSTWLRPAATLAVAAGATLLGVFVGQEAGRRTRWLEGLSLALLVVAAGAVGLFVLQYVVRPTEIVRGLSELLAYFRGDAAGEKFAVANNWLIWAGGGATLRAISPLFPSPNNLGGFIGLVGPFAVMQALYSASARWRAVAVFGVALSAAALVATYSRSSMVAAGVGAAVAGLLLLMATRRSKEGVLAIARTRVGIVGLAIALGLGLGAAGLLTAGGPGVAGQAQTRVQAPLDDPSVTIRITIDGNAAEALAADPIRGVGLGNWAIAAGGGARAYVHDVYLEYGAATGILGLAWAILLVAIPLCGGALASRRGRTLQELTAGIAGASVGAYAAVQFLFDDNLLNPQYAWLLALMVGLAVRTWARPRIA